MSPACIVGDTNDVTPTLEKMYRAMGQELPQIKRILELNPGHPVMQVMTKMYERDKDAGRLADYCELLYDQALLTEGSPIKDPLRFARLVSDLMVSDGKTVIG